MGGGFRSSEKGVSPSFLLPIDAWNSRADYTIKPINNAIGLGEGKI